MNKLNVDSVEINSSLFSKSPIKLGASSLWLDGLNRLRLSTSTPSTQWEGLNISSCIESGNSRHSVEFIGYTFFDRTKNKPVWWDGVKWIYADGTSV